MMSIPLKVSVIVPVHNAARYFGACLDAIRASSFQPLEIIVVDDASTDDSARIAETRGAAVIRSDSKSGPAAARNRGASTAKGDLLLFLDSDVLVKEDTIAKVLEAFQDPDLTAVFGSYDDAPAETDFLSQYRNLLHHFVHQTSNAKAATFWAGCGAIRRATFLAVGGFDAERYSEPAIEDIELGYRLHNLGHTILLDKTIQVKHLKKWTFYSIVRTDVQCRALPWARLMLERQETVRDLNLKTSHRVSAGLVGLVTAAFPLLVLEARFLYIQAALLLILVLLNQSLYRFFLAKRGLRFAVGSVTMHCFYYLYSLLCFAYCWLSQPVLRRRLKSSRSPA